MPDTVAPDARITDCLPDGYIGLGFVASIKALDRGGDVCIIHVRTDEISRWEAVGMLTSMCDDQRAAMQQTDDEP